MIGVSKWLLTMPYGTSGRRVGPIEDLEWPKKDPEANQQMSRTHQTNGNSDRDFGEFGTSSKKKGVAMERGKEGRQGLAFWFQKARDCKP